MNCYLPRPARALLLCLVLGLQLPSASHAAAIWTNATDGLWADPANWLGQATPTLSGVYLTNAGSKTITVDGATPGTVLSFTSMSLWAPPSGLNTLRLADLGAGRTLLASNGNIDIRMRGALQVSNADFVVTNVFGANSVGFNIWAGAVTLDSGSIVVRESAANTNAATFTRVGRTNTAVLTINGGSMLSSMLEVGQAGLPGARSHGTIQMNGGLLTVPGELSIGTSAGCTGVVNVLGGKIRVPDHRTNITRVADKGVGFLTVSNGQVTLGNVSVGRHDGSDGTLQVVTPGVVGANDDFSIGRFPGSTGRVRVDGGILIVTNHPVWVGREGRGLLAVSAGVFAADSLLVAAIPTNTAFGGVLLTGGATALSSNLIVGSPGFATGEVTLAGGRMSVTNASRTASVTVLAGAITITNGTLITDRLLLTNTFGVLRFPAGTLISGATVVSNNQPFVVGDGVHPAILELGEGSHVFAGGLVISSNATLTGCGTVEGTIVNQGTNRLGCAGVPEIGAIDLTGGRMTLSVATRPGSSYTLEHKVNLEDPDWIGLVTMPGTGGNVLLIDPSPVGPSRFYRVRMD